MGRKSSITQLDPRIREAVDGAIREGRATIEDIVFIIRDMGASISASAVGRYKARAEEQMKRYREAQEIAKVWVGKLQAEPEGDVGRLLSEMLRTTAFQTLGDIDAASPQDLMFLGKALKDLAGAEKLTTDRILKVRQEAAKEAVAVMEKSAKANGVSQDTIKIIRRDLLGMAA